LDKTFTTISQRSPVQQVWGEFIAWGCLALTDAFDNKGLFYTTSEERQNAIDAIDGCGKIF
jgi:hypothetical protein